MNSYCDYSQIVRTFEKSLGPWGLSLLIGCLGGAYEKHGQVWFRGVYRARGF